MRQEWKPVQECLEQTKKSREHSSGGSRCCYRIKRIPPTQKRKSPFNELPLKSSFQLVKKPKSSSAYSCTNIPLWINIHLLKESRVKMQLVWYGIIIHIWNLVLLISAVEITLACAETLQQWALIVGWLGNIMDHKAHYKIWPLKKCSDTQWVELMFSSSWHGSRPCSGRPQASNVTWRAMTSKIGFLKNVGWYGANPIGSHALF